MKERIEPRYMKFKAKFKIPSESWIIIVEGKADSKKEFLDGCKKLITTNHRLIKCEEVK